MTWRHIMFAVELHEALGLRVTNKIASLAKAFDAEIELFHCAFDRGIVQAVHMGAASSHEEIRRIVESRHCELEGVAQRLRDRAGIRVRSTVRWDYPAYEGIIRHVLRHKPDLLVVQTTRHARFARLMLTQTDYRLIEACPCPLLLVKTDRPYAHTAVVAAVDPTHAHDKTAALDRAILGAASVISDGVGAALHVYHSCAPWPSVLKQTPVMRRIPEAVYAEVCAMYEAKCEARVKDLARGVKVRKARVHLRWGETSEALPAFANSVSAGIVVMGAVSRSALRRVFIGHTAERVLDALNCDVLIVKPPGFRSPVGRESVHRLPKGGLRGPRYTWR